MTARDLPDYHEVDGKLICDDCGRERVVGEWGWCPHGVGNGGLDPLEPYVDCQLLPQNDKRCTSVDALGRRGVPISHRSDRQAIMKEQNLQYGTGKWRPGS